MVYNGFFLVSLWFIIRCLLDWVKFIWAVVGMLVWMVWYVKTFWVWNWLVYKLSDMIRICWWVVLRCKRLWGYCRVCK